MRWDNIKTEKYYVVIKNNNNMSTSTVYIVVDTNLVDASDDTVSVFGDITGMLNELYTEYVQPYNKCNGYDSLEHFGLTSDDFYNYTDDEHWEKLKIYLYEMWQLVIVKRTRSLNNAT